jgi:hypothetical protein
MKKILLICILVMLGGCATTKTLEAVDGSKADATVKLAYEYGIFEKPIIDWSMAQKTARERCGAWGYKNAEKFGGSQEKCLAFNGYGNCINMQVNIIYQCIGK